MMRGDLAAAEALPGDETDVPARARLAEASRNVDAAIQLLRDRKDPILGRRCSTSSPFAGAMRKR